MNKFSVFSVQFSGRTRLEPPTNCSIRGPLKTKKAFTLLEVLLALAVFSFAVMGIALALDKTMDLALVSRRQTRIRHELESRLAELRGKPVFLGKATLDPDSDGTQYDTETSQPELVDGNGNKLSNIYLLSVHASWKQGGTTMEDKAEMYVLQ
jgi:prepilin-type N-terminal cleavage/methylation domain-containing protein